MHLNISQGDFLIPLPMEVVADMANAVSGVLESIPHHCTVNMALLKTLVPPLSDRESIELDPDALEWVYTDNIKHQAPVTFRANTLAHLLPEVIHYKATVKATPNQYRAWVLPALENINNYLTPSIQ